MVVGFNHNFSYKGQVYHVQTEDSGIKNPHIITLLYRGGTILASKKTSYADIIKVDHLEAVVEDLMKSQHREMLRQLKNGEFDELLGLPAETTKAATTPAAVNPLPVAEKVSAPIIAPTITSPPIAAPLTAAPVPPAALAPKTTPAAPIKPPPESKPMAPPAPAALTLDDIILSYMVGEENKK